MRSRTRGGTATAVLGAVAVTGLFALVVTFAPLPRRALVAFDDVAMGLVAAAASAGCWWAGATASGRTRAGWWLLAGSCAAFGMGQAIWTALQLADPGLRAPFPSWADLGFVVSLVLMGAAMVVFAELPGGWAARLRMVVDGLIVGTAALDLAWIVAIGALYRESTGSVLARAIGLAYPIGSIVTLLLAAGLLTRSRVGRGSVLALLGATASFAVANGFYAVLVVGGRYATGHPVDTGWVAGFALIGLGAWLAATGTQRELADRTREGLLLAVPQALVLALATVGAAKLLGGWRPGALELAAGTVLGVLLVTRHVATQVENLRLRHDLEARVAARTAALAEAEARFARAVRAGGLSVWHTELGTTRVVWAANSEAVLGAAPDRTGPVELMELVDPRDRADVEAAVSQALATGGGVPGGPPGAHRRGIRTVGGDDR